MRIQGNQRNVPASRRRLAEALMRAVLNQRAKQVITANAATAANPMLAQQAQHLQLAQAVMPQPTALENPQPAMLPNTLGPQGLNPPETEAPIFETLLVEPHASSINGALPPSALQRSLELSPDDVKILKKVLTTEAIAGLPPEIYRQQAAGIVDTILNRRVHGKWGDSIEAVVNAPYQFSDINGPVAWRRGRRGGVNQISDDVLKNGAGLLASQFVDEYLARRAAGEPSSVGGHLNYANPHYSDPGNLSWIRKLDGPRLGQGQAVHWHGTAQGLTPVDPNYAIRIAGQGQSPAALGVEPLLEQALMPNAAPQPRQRPQIHPVIIEALMRNANR
jgi:hypothetical protein